MQYILVALGILGSLYAAYRIARSNFGAAQTTWRSFAPYAAVIAILGAINVYLFILPMAMRM